LSSTKASPGLDKIHWGREIGVEIQKNPAKMGK
jgi:hypothetical protein